MLIIDESNGSARTADFNTENAQTTCQEGARYVTFILLGNIILSKDEYIYNFQFLFQEFCSKCSKMSGTRASTVFTRCNSTVNNSFPKN